MSAEGTSEKIKVRQYRDSDFEICRSIWAEMTRYHQDIYKDTSLGGDEPGRGFEQYMNNPTRRGPWVAEIEGSLVGLAGLLVNSAEYSEVEPVAVSEPYRSQGIGSALVERVVTEARKTGARFLTIRPGVRNKGALSLYVRLGFNKVWTVELIQELEPAAGIKWLPGLEVHGNELEY